MLQDPRPQEEVQLDRVRMDDFQRLADWHRRAPGRGECGFERAACSLILDADLHAAIVAYADSARPCPNGWDFGFHNRIGARDASSRTTRNVFSTAGVVFSPNICRAATASHRCHWNAKAVGFPVQLPSFAVSCCPTRAVPEMVGRSVFLGGAGELAAATVAVSSDCAEADPSGLVAVTRTRIVRPASAAVSV